MASFPVMKFGGAALADGAAVRRACAVVAERAPKRPAVVVSAHAGVTALLEREARAVAAGKPRGDEVRVRHHTLLSQLGLDPELLDRHLWELATVLDELRGRGEPGRSALDFVLSFGERMSARIVAACLREQGVAATAVDAFDLGLSPEGALRPLPAFDSAVRSALGAVGGIPVVTGFLAQDGAGNLTTLGPNGSDLTAALLAEALDAGEVQLWKTVPGVMSADPGLVPAARLVESMSFSLAAELAGQGASVLHPNALAPARRAGVCVRVLDVNRPERAGTLIEEHEQAGGAPRAVAVASEPALVALSVRGGGPALAGLFARMAGARLTPRFTLAEGGGLTVFVPAGEGVDALARESTGVSIAREVASVAVVGHGGAVLGARALEQLHEAGIGVERAFLGSGRAQAFLVDPDHRVAAVGALHEGLLEAPLA
ncbi:MAG: aspartate kinase [Planctomycetota bacterium]|jgi:aspartate kinase|nr:aspartate kinase [Planctomycetota bacterium]MDP6988549.1 aspartate kinase [Planctomycetota bacterium]